MIQFRTKLEATLRDKLEEWVGVGSDASDYVHTFDDYLHPFDLDITPDPFPFLVYTVRGWNESGRSDGEIGNPHDLREWDAHIYYVDTRLDREEGKTKRNKIMGIIEKELELSRPNFFGFEAIDGNGKREYIWDVRLTNGVFDTAQEDEYHTFVNELYITFDTART